MDDLAHLFGAYFYEGWDEYEYSSWQHAVDDFVRRSPARVPGATASLRSLLAETSAESQLEARLRGLGCTYAPEEGDHAWLAILLSRLQQSALDDQSPAE